jgi:hypothetical protein
LVLMKRQSKTEQNSCVSTIQIFWYHYECWRWALTFASARISQACSTRRAHIAQVFPCNRQAACAPWQWTPSLDRASFGCYHHANPDWIVKQLQGKFHQ